MPTTWFVIGENVWPVALLGKVKKGVNRQRRNNNIDQTLYLISHNTHRNIQNNRDVLYSCGTDRAVVFKWSVRLQMDTCLNFNDKCIRLQLVFKCYGQHF